jgi:hypothetical protein
MRAEKGRTLVSIGPLDAPPGGIVVTWPFAGSPAGATVNGRAVAVSERGVTVRETPAEVVFRR